MITAIYARYSSELQSDRSIEDQVALCRSYAQREGLVVTTTYDDRAQSGSSTASRMGLARLMRDAGQHLFTHLVVESLDRLSRDQADLATIYKRLTFLGVEIREVHGGKATPLNAAVRGLVGTIYLADLADKTRRGLAGNVSEGLSAGGRGYGYAPVKGETGRLQRVEHEAEVIAQVFTLYTEGASPRDIAGRLNAAKVSPPRGTRWNASTINGSRQRQNGILHNALYTGELVWNRTRMVKDPDTGRRVSRPNPEAEWKRRQMPDLAIVPPELWQAAAARTAGRKATGTHRIKVTRLFSGLLKCPGCGGSLVVKDQRHGRARVICSTFKESGACDRRNVLQLDRIEAAVIGALRSEFARPAALAAYAEAYNAERQRLAADTTRNRGKMEARLAAVTGEIDRTARLMIQGVLDPERHGGRLKELETEERQLRTDLAAPESAAVVALHPAALVRYRQQIERLHQELAEAPEAAQSIRELVERVTVWPDYRVQIAGRLATLLEMPLHTGGVQVVAGERYSRHPTFILQARG